MWFSALPVARSVAPGETGASSIIKDRIRAHGEACVADVCIGKCSSGPDSVIVVIMLGPWALLGALLVVLCWLRWCDICSGDLGEPRRAESLKAQRKCAGSPLQAHLGRFCPKKGWEFKLAESCNKLRGQKPVVLENFFQLTVYSQVCWSIGQRSWWGGLLLGIRCPTAGPPLPGTPWVPRTHQSLQLSRSPLAEEGVPDSAPRLSQSHRKSLQESSRQGVSAGRPSPPPPSQQNVLTSSNLTLY